MAKKPEKKPRNFRPLLKFVAAACMLAAFVLFARAYFLEHPPQNGQPLASDTSRLGVNPPTSIDSVNTDLNSAGTSVWGDAITDALNLPATDGLWLSINDNSNVYLGELTAGKFTVKFTLPQTAAGIHFYATQSVLYFTPSSNTADAQMTGIEKGQITNLLRLDGGWEFNSVYFDPAQKQFYADIFDHNHHSKLQVLRQGASPQDIADTSLFTSPQILGVDVAGHQLYFSATNVSGPQCESLDLIAKTTNNKDCAGIQTNATNLIVSVNSPALPLNKDFKGSILLTNTSNGNQQFLKTGDAGDVFSPVVWNQAQTAVVYSQIKSAADNSLSLVPQTLRAYALSDHSLVREIKTLPGTITELLLDSKNIIYAVVAGDQGHQELWQEPATLVDSPDPAVPAQNWTQVNLNICTQTCQFAAL